MVRISNPKTSIHSNPKDMPMEFFVILRDQFESDYIYKNHVIFCGILIMNFDMGLREEGRLILCYFHQKSHSFSSEGMQKKCICLLLQTETSHT